MLKSQMQSHKWRTQYIDISFDSFPVTYFNLSWSYVCTSSSPAKRCWRSASYTTIAAVFDKFNDLTCVSFIGRRKHFSSFSHINSSGRPVVSFPNMKNCSSSRAKSISSYVWLANFVIKYNGRSPKYSKNASRDL